MRSWKAGEMLSRTSLHPSARLLDMVSKVFPKLSPQ